MQRTRWAVKALLLSSSLQLRFHIFFLGAICGLSADGNHCFTVNTDGVPSSPAGEPHLHHLLILFFGLFRFFVSEN